MSAGKKKLTEAPTNLKEAIDWVLRVSGGDLTYAINTSALNVALPKLLEVPVNNEGFLVKSIDAIKLRDRNPCPITAVATGLQKFIGYEFKKDTTKNTYTISIGQNGVVKQGVIYTSSNGKPQPQTPPSNGTYTSAYYSSSWSTDIEVNGVQTKDEKRNTCVINFFIAVEKIFEGLTELYYNCKTEWAGQSLSGSSDEGLKHFMDRNGFEKAKLNSNMTGEQIISKALNGLKEFDTAYDSAGSNPSLETFRSQLEQNAMSNPSNNPLSALYILATYAYVQSTIPASPSFLGYSGTAALAGGAYGLNFAGLGTFMSALLA
ncbi:variant erythrocyte surface antigen-1 family protein [Babesia caballi]|uniref:Variant erythrocyte surface antigen-1 family protein n=1 Tax=Babesia caballi TaxID=5871 RepID=A0AAV4LYI2_BABCB|nr:variant erythrocyte surface antigen-1 family protein [Babesia caballi]